MSKKLPGGDLQKARRVSALIRLNNQIKSGTKTEKKTGNIIPLTKEDKARIAAEIRILESRI